MQSNKVKDLPKLLLPNLRRLDLSSNGLDRVSEEFDGLEKLEFLDLASNNLSNISNLRNMPELRELLVNNNNLRKFVGLEGCTNIQILNLKANEISHFEEEIPALENLKMLNLQNNRLATMEEIEKLKDYALLETLVLSFNPFVDNNKDSYMYQLIHRFPTCQTINSTKVPPL